MIIAEVGNTAVFMLSDLAKAIGGEIGLSMAG
jgi:enoyl-[acyl-carrier-protein] reductase (NADH)